ncbi:TVP38/TMEM64 family protein [Salipaludibacillus sp. CF4.18]|uniref:TVP38/TMEM64 family protein n=1 Tax=Salipaludibacillus sp. CF4.18 TaxID=3373081 RepID=UPI003EE5AF8D
MKNLVSISIMLIVLLLFVFFNWDWIMQLRSQDVTEFTENVEELGYGVLLITIPLMMIQNIITLFPILLLIMLHFMSFGMIQGFLFSFIGTTLGTILCFWLARSMGEKWVNRFWAKKEKKFSKILHLISSYGVLMIVLLRSIPIMPSNLISISAAVSPMEMKPYLISTVVGNISMIWLLSLLSSFLWIEGNLYTSYLIGYLLFSVTIVGFYGIRFYRRLKPQVNDHSS